MSTAGKVLSVLVVLVALVWVALSATVAQLNRNGAQALEDLQKKVATLETEFVQAERNLQQLKDATHTEQLVTQNDITVLQVRQSDQEKELAGIREILSRVKIQLADAESMLKSGQALDEERLAEKNAEIKAKADAEAEVERLKAENAEMLARLTGLRDKFKSRFRENKQLVEKLLKAKDKPTTRPASLTR